MVLNTSQKATVWYSIGLVLFWAILFFTHTTSGTPNYLFSFFMGLLPLVGGFVAMRRSRSWSGTKGFVGKGIFFSGLGLFFWGCGGIIWSYYNFFQGVAAPYPSFADLGYAPSVFFYCIGAVYLARAAGADLGLKQRFAKLFIIVVPIAMFFISYYFLVTVARHGVLITHGDPLLKIFFDLAYPIGDFISLTLAVIISGLSFAFLVKEYKVAIISLLLGLAVMFVADSSFSYTTTLGIYYNADFVDLFFAIALSMLTFGALGFSGDTKGEGVHGLHVFRFLGHPNEV